MYIYLDACKKKKSDFNSLNLIPASMQGFISLSQTGLKLNEWCLLKKESQERSYSISKCS